MESKRKILQKLFFSTLYLSAFTFGGGYVIVTLMKKKFVDEYHWIEENEMLDLVAIAQSSPGPIAVNSATFVGIKIAGIPGAFAATFGCILPPCIIVTILAKLYLKYRNMTMMQEVLHSLRPAVVAMIGAAGISILATAFWGSEEIITFVGTKWSLVIIFFICLVLLRKVKMNPIWVMLLAGVMKVVVSNVVK